jgi:phage shock protein A
MIRVYRTDKDRAAQAAYERVSEAMSQLFYRGLSEADVDRFERTLERILATLTEADAAAALSRGKEEG